MPKNLHKCVLLLTVVTVVVLSEKCMSTIVRHSIVILLVLTCLYLNPYYCINTMSVLANKYLKLVSPKSPTWLVAHTGQLHRRLSPNTIL